MFETIANLLRIIFGRAPRGSGIELLGHRVLVSCSRGSMTSTLLEPTSTGSLSEEGGVTVSRAFGGFTIAGRVFVGLKGRRMPFGLAMHRRLWAMGLRRRVVFPLARRLLGDRVEDVCELCGCPITGEAYNVWHDEGVPMPTCAACLPQEFNRSGVSYTERSTLDDLEPSDGEAV